MFFRIKAAICVRPPPCWFVLLLLLEREAATELPDTSTRAARRLAKCIHRRVVSGEWRLVPDIPVVPEVSRGVGHIEDVNERLPLDPVAELEFAAQAHRGPDVALTTVTATRNADRTIRPPPA